MNLAGRGRETLYMGDWSAVLCSPDLTKTEPALIVRPALAGPDRLSASVSFASTSMVTRVSSLVLAVSLMATGASLRFARLEERRAGEECGVRWGATQWMRERTREVRE